MIAALLATPSGCFTVGDLREVGPKEGSGSFSRLRWLTYVEIASLSSLPRTSNLVSVVGMGSEETIMLNDNKEVGRRDDQSKKEWIVLNRKPLKRMFWYINQNVELCTNGTIR